MEDKELSALKALAEAATPGMWEMHLSNNATPYITHGKCSDGNIPDLNDLENRICVMPAEISMSYNSYANSKFIAAANPATILSLISRVEQAEAARADMETRKDSAYFERNQVVAGLAKCFPSGVARTAIEGWSEDWHGCVYINLPTGQVSWHFHDSQAHLFDGLPQYDGKWDGHDTPEKYRRVAALTLTATGTGEAMQIDQALEPAPGNNLPNWSECALRVENSSFIAKRVAEGGYGPEPDSKLATELHRFIYEYDYADPYRSAWFLHRLELVIEEAKRAVATSIKPADGVAGAREVPLPKWIDDLKGNDPTIDGLIEYIVDVIKLDNEKIADLRAQLARQQAPVGDTLDEDSKFIDLMTAWANEGPGEDALAAFDAIVAYITAWKDAQLAEARQSALLFKREADALWNRVHEAEAKLAAQAQGEPVAWEFRFYDQDNEPHKWGEWERVEARWGGTIADRVAEIRAYIARGYKYELRALYAGAAPQADEVRDAARWRFTMEMQELARTGDQPEPIIAMWRKVYAEHRLHPTREEYEAATDACIALRTTAADNQEGGEA